MLNSSDSLMQSYVHVCACIFLYLYIAAYNNQSEGILEN